MNNYGSEIAKKYNSINDHELNKFTTLDEYQTNEFFKNKKNSLPHSLSTKYSISNK